MNAIVDPDLGVITFRKIYEGFHEWGAEIELSGGTKLEVLLSVHDNSEWDALLQMAKGAVSQIKKDEHAFRREIAEDLARIWNETDHEARDANEFLESLTYSTLEVISYGSTEPEATLYCWAENVDRPVDVHLNEDGTIRNISSD